MRTQEHIAQQRCAHPFEGAPCVAWRLSRPGGQTWKPCWRCKVDAPPIGEPYTEQAVSLGDKR